jgi:hypothetical protein
MMDVFTILPRNSEEEQTIGLDPNQFKRKPLTLLKDVSISIPWTDATFTRRSVFKASDINNTMVGGSWKIFSRSTITRFRINSI